MTTTEELNAVGGRKCPDCGGTVAPGDAKCQNCGASMTASAGPTLEERVFALERTVIALAAARIEV